MLKFRSKESSIIGSNFGNSCIIGSRESSIILSWRPGSNDSGNHPFFDKGTMQSARCWYFGRAIISPILSTRTQIGSNLWEIKPLVSKWFRHCGRRPIYTRGRLLDNQIGRRFGPILRRGCGDMIWFCSCQHERLWFGCSRTIKITPKISTSKAAARNSCPKSMVWNEKKTVDSVECTW